MFWGILSHMVFTKPRQSNFSPVTRTPARESCLNLSKFGVMVTQMVLKKSTPRNTREDVGITSSLCRSPIKDSVSFDYDPLVDTLNMEAPYFNGNNLLNTYTEPACPTHHSLHAVLQERPEQLRQA